MCEPYKHANEDWSEGYDEGREDGYGEGFGEGYKKGRNHRTLGCNILILVGWFAVLSVIIYAAFW